MRRGCAAPSARYSAGMRSSVRAARPRDSRTPDGKPLLAVNRGIPPYNYGRRVYASRPPWTEIVLWLLNAAASGVVGDLTYNALQKIIAKARTMQASFVLPAIGPRSDDSPSAPIVEPSDELRDHLIKIAHDPVARFRHISPSKGRNLWSKAEVSLTERGTWKVQVREIGTQQLIVIEIDLEVSTTATIPMASRCGSGTDLLPQGPARVGWYSTFSASARVEG